MGILRPLIPPSLLTVMQTAAATLQPHTDCRCHSSGSRVAEQPLFVPAANMKSRATRTARALCPSLHRGAPLRALQPGDPHSRHAEAPGRGVAAQLPSPYHALCSQSEHSRCPPRSSSYNCVACTLSLGPYLWGPYNCVTCGAHEQAAQSPVWPVAPLQDGETPLHAASWQGHLETVSSSSTSPACTALPDGHRRAH